MKAKVVVICMTLLGGCVTSQGQLQQITTNLPIAIQSAQTLVAQAQANPALATNTSVMKQASKISAYLSTGTQDINTVNTLAAALLNLAGAAGVTLAGL